MVTMVGGDVNGNIDDDYVKLENKKNIENIFCCNEVGLIEKVVQNDFTEGPRFDNGDDESNEIESDNDLTTVGSSSPFDIERLQKLVHEDWELEILRDSPFYCEGDENEDSLTGPYKILFHEHKTKNSSRYVGRRNF